MSYTPIPHGTPDWDVPVNAAFSSQDNRITALEGQAVTQPGIYVPPGWGQFWRPARNGPGKSKILCAGDSVTAGHYATSLRTTNWVGRMRTEVQTTYGNGGSGFFSTSRSAPASSVPAGTIAAWQANDSFAATSGTWANGSSNLGPGMNFLTGNAGSSVITFKVTGTTVKIYNFTGPSLRADYTYSIDGGAPVLVDVVTGATSVMTTTITGLANIEHTVTLTWAGLATEIFYPIGVSGENAAGVQVDNMGRAGIATAPWNADPTNTSAWNGGASNPCDLLIVSLGLNDATTSITGDSWINSMSSYLQAVRSANNGATDIIFLAQHMGNFAGSTFYANYMARIQDLATNYGAALVNMWTLGRNSWNYWNSLGYWGDANAPGAAGTDAVHLSDAGHQAVANAITPIVMS